MKNKYYITVILILSTIILYAYIQYGELNIIKKEIVKEMEKKNNLFVELEIQKINRITELEFNGKLIDHEDEITNTKGEKKKLYDVLGEKKLVLRYSELNCDDCIDKQIKYLNKYADSIGCENIILLTNYNNNHHMQRFRKINRIKFEIYNIGKKLNENIRDINLPYLFIIDRCNMRINNMFVPQKELPDQTEKYFYEVYTKYFK